MVYAGCFRSVTNYLSARSGFCTYECKTEGWLSMFAVRPASCRLSFVVSAQVAEELSSGASSTWSIVRSFVANYFELRVSIGRGMYIGASNIREESDRREDELNDSQNICYMYCMCLQFRFFCHFSAVASPDVQRCHFAPFKLTLSTITL